MKICMMTNTYLPHVGGVARSVQTFTEDYRHMGHDVLVVAPTFANPEGTKPEAENGIVRVPSIEKFNDTDFSVCVSLPGPFSDVLEGFVPDVVHSHHPFLLGDTALRLAANEQVPVVFTHHTLYEQYTHYVPFDSPALKQFVIELATNYANLCDGVIAPSASLAEIIRRRGVQVPIEIIPTGIDTEAFANGDGQAFRKQHGIPLDAPVVGHLGRLAPEKNLGFLGRAVAGFLKDNAEALFLVVGVGPSEQEIRNHFKQEGLGGRLVIAGRLTGPDLFNAYRAMDVFVFSSQSETQGMVLAEAMAAGLPVVALDASGVREVVRHEKNGFMLAANASEESFTSHLQKLISNPELKSRYSKGARETAVEFARERSAQKAIAFYEHLCQRKRRERDEEGSDALTVLLKRIEVEWNLLSEKAGSAFNALLAQEKSEETPGDRPS